MKHILILLGFLASFNVMSENNTPLPGMSQEDWNKHLELNKRFEKERKLRYENELKQNPPVPPWLKYPEHSRYDIFWRMGMGETYLMEYIAPYFQYASKEEIKAYKEKHTAIGEWTGWYE